MIQELIEEFKFTSSNSFGLCVIKKLLALCIKEEYAKFQPSILKEIVSACIELSQNPYGNYAVQITLETFDPLLCDSIIESLKGKLTQLSITKYSSNVVERCLERALPKTKELLLQELNSSDSIISTNIS